MPTKLAIDKEHDRRRKQAKIIELFGTIDYDRTYDYKKQRRKSSRVRVDPPIRSFAPTPPR